MYFYDFIIKKHINRNTPLGDLARDIAEDCEFPKEGDKTTISNHLRDHRADFHCLDTFEKAWNAYLKYLKEQE